GLREQLERRIVRDVPSFDDAAVAVIGVLAEADVGDEDDARDFLSKLLEGPLHDAVRVPRAGSARVLRGRDAGEDDAWYTFVPGRLRLLDQGVGRKVVSPRHRRDLPSHPLPLAHEERVDQVRGDDLGLADHGAEEIAVTEPPGTLIGIAHLRRSGW